MLRRRPTVLLTCRPWGHSPRTMAFGMIILLVSGLVSLSAAHHEDLGPSKIDTYDGCKGGVITSPNYPMNYPPNQFVQSKIQVPNTARVKITMTYLDLEPEATCKYDYLRMDGVDPPGKRYCGDFTKHKDPLDLVFISTSPTVDIFFHSDDLVQKKGFHLKFEPEICCMHPCGRRGLCKPKPYTKTCEFTCCLKHKYLDKCEKPIIIEPSKPVIHEEEVRLICNSSHGDDGSLTYVWKKNGDVIPGANSRILTFPASMFDANDKYICLALLADSSSDPSDPVDVEVKPPKPKVEGKTNLTDGDSTTLHCVSPVISAQYEWYKNGVLLRGQIAKTLDLSVSLPDDGSRYRCKIKVGEEFSDPSDPAMLKVIPKRPSIDFLPDNEMLHGESFKVRCIDRSNVPHPVYMFFINGVSQEVSHSNILNQQADIHDIRSYSCAVSADHGVRFSLRSEVIKPIVRALKPYVEGKTNLTDGDSTVLTCLSLHPKLYWEYEWYVNGQLLPDQTAQSLHLYSVKLSQDGHRYWCKIKVGQTVSDPSDPVMLKVIPKRPSIEFLPDNEMLHGESFQVRCNDQSNVLNPVYMFFINGVSQGVSHSNILNRQADIHNIRSYSCAVSADGGVRFSLRSEVIKPIVRAHEPYVEGKTNLTDGDSTVLKCLSLHPSSPSHSEYKWYLNGKLLPDQIVQSLHLYDVKLSQDGHRYWCKIKVGETVSDSSDPVMLKVIPKKPLIRSLPEQTLEDGDSFRLQCISQSQGVNNALYVFYINNEELPPSPSNTLQQTADLRNIKTYKCKMSVDGGKHYSEPSDPIKPTVRPKEPLVTGDQTHIDGDTTTLTCRTSSPAKHFRWFHNGVIIPGETSSTLTMNMDLAKDGSNFTCTVALDEFSEPSDPSDPLEMSVIPKPPTIQLIPKEMEDGARYEVRCISESDDGRPLLYVFSVGGKDLPPSRSNTLLQYANICNISAYTCKVSADQGESYSGPSKPVTPLVKPQKPFVTGVSKLTDGDTSTWTCQSPSHPCVGIWTYRWYVNNLLQSRQPFKSMTMTVSMENDANHLTCAVAYGSSFSDISDPLVLEIIPKKPLISIIPKGNLRHGSTFYLKCSSVSIVNGPVLWRFTVNNNALPPSYNDTLQRTADINRINSYSCEMSVDGGDDFSKPSDPVKPKVIPTKPHLTGDFELIDGEVTDFICNLPSELPLSPVYRWFKNGRPIEGVPNSRFLRVLVDLRDDGSMYACMVVFDSISSEQSEPKKLTVIPKTPFINILPDKTMEDGDSFELKCVSQSKYVKNALYVFLINNRTLSSSSSNTLQQTADINNPKTYKCKMSVDGGKHFSEPSDPVKPTVRPKEPSVIGDPTHTDGDTTTLICRASSGRHFLWYHNGVLIPGETSSTLTLKMDLAKDGSKFTCKVALDEFSEPSDPSDPLEMSVIPKTPTIQLNPKKMEDGEPFEVRCISQSSDGRPLLYIFTVGGKDLPPRRSNTLPQNANINDINTYTCKVSADDGQSYSKRSLPVTPIICPHPKCWPPCKVGLTYEHVFVNPSGCRICQCRPCPSVHCPTNCPTNRVVHETDPNGCKKCSCYPYHCKDPVCPRCREGVDWEYDDHGCKLCVCKKTCKEPICPRCPYGTTWKYYDNGCKYCACKKGDYHLDGDDE